MKYMEINYKKCECVQQFLSKRNKICTNVHICLNINVTFEPFLPLQIHTCNAAFMADEKIEHLSHTTLSELLVKDISDLAQ